ncbi:DNA polymerase III, tau subunit [uncultured Paludibacter sp.]|uniref:DNA polymerase III subunit gamma/tau n=1 Tax=uncultured Paludibacter sp. TaxID=497635 RepID=A0A653AAL9_9BACT|nr:DNA polymerase III, tau subunit [uncultured Paludibacter sp.]
MESFIVSARKYRPTTFKSVVGQTALTTTLKNAIKSNHLAHAYLFCGPRGVGKTTCARIFAKTINCANLTADFEACNECESCKSFNDQRSYNIHELDAASNNGVDDIRSLTDQVRIPPQMGKYSVYIIDEVHMLSQGAFNAFLKTLEEPPAHAIFILATTEKHKIIPTILSRCQIYDFNRITVTDTINHLKYVASQEGVTIDENALNVIAQKSDGGMRDALSIFDQLVSFCGNNITYQKVIENLNVLDYEYYFRLINTFLQGNVTEALLVFNEILNKGFEAQHFITGLSSHLRDVLVSKDTSTIQLLEVGAEIGERYKQQALSCPIPFIFSALNISNECDLNYRISKNKRLLVELALIKMCQITHPIKVEEQSVPQLKTVQPTPNQSTKTEEKPVEEKKNPEIIEKKEIQEEKQKEEIPLIEKKVSENAPKFQRPQSISISNIGKTEENNVVSDIVQPQFSTDNKFTEEELSSKWNEFVLNHIDDTRLKSLLTTNKPQIGKEDTLKVKVNNRFQENEIHQLHIVDFLRKELQNNNIRLEIEIIPESEQTSYLSPEETYKKMTETNPALEKLRKNLEMEID